ncbi:MAG: glycosyltransferase, partial [Thermodesulfobacteriota bacterium]
MNDSFSTLCAMHRPKIAIIHPRLIGGGGSESRALWATEALKHDCDVSLITMGSPDLTHLNEYYGTNINRNEIKIIQIPIPPLFKNHFDALRGSRLARFCKQKASEFDLMISTYNIMDFGRRGIQFIADFSFDDGLRRTLHPAPQGVKGIFYRKSLLRWMYLKLSTILAGPSEDGLIRNVTVANSQWSGGIMKKVYGIESQTIYPPVVGESPDTPWDKRENGFICIGRLVPEKGINRIIEILQKVKKKGETIHLHIFGGGDNAQYIKSVQRLCDENREWAFMEGKIFGAKKQEIIAQHKFG